MDAYQSAKTGWEWESAPTPTPLRIPAQLAQLLFDEDQAYETIRKIYREYMGKVAPEYEIDPVEGREKRKVTLHLDTNHVIFTNFTHHFRYTTDGQDYFLDAAKKKAAVKAGQWLFDVLQQSGSVFNPATQLVPLGHPGPYTPPAQTNQTQLLQEFMAYRAKTEEQLRLLHQSVSVLLDENQKLGRQNQFIIRKLEEIKEAQSKSAFESLADAAFPESHGRK